MLKTEIQLHPDLITFSTQRGVPPFGSSYLSFNACHYVGDSPEHVADCRNEICWHLSIDMEQLVIPRQTHSDSVAIIDSIPFDTARLEGVDAIVTALPDVALAINTADCVPVLLAVPEMGIIAVAHCGWRGVVNDLLPNTVKAICSLGALPYQIKVALGPAICPDCFEVGEEVAACFADKFSSPSIILRSGYEKPHINLSVAIAEHLKMLGVDSAQITPSMECTRCNPEKYFSARVHTINSGRILTLICRPS